MERSTATPCDPASCHDVRRAFSLTELLVVVVIISVLLALIIPGIQQLRKSSRSTQCLSNLRTIANGVLLYAADNDGHFPPYISPVNSIYRSWDYTIKPYLGLPQDQPSKIFKCPADPRPYAMTGGNYARTYSFNAYYPSVGGWPPAGCGLMSIDSSGGVPTTTRTLAQVSRPSKCIMISEWCSDTGGQTNANYQNQLAFSGLSSIWLWKGQMPVLSGGKTIHDPVINYVFVDGHAEALLLADVSSEFAASGNCLWTAVAQ